MAEFTIKKWRCDRCGVVYDKRPPRKWEGAVRYQVLVVADYQVAGGNEIDWKEMCDQCDAEVGAALAALRPATKPAGGAGD
jgi:hypothetical protein